MTSNETIKAVKEWVIKLSANLIDRYETNSLQGEKIAGLLAKFDLNNIKLRKAQNLTCISLLFICVCAAISFLVMLYYTSQENGVNGMARISGIAEISSVIVAVLLMVIANKVQDGYREASKKNASELAPFLSACEALKSPVGRTEHSFTEESVKDNFVTHAVRILEAEKNLDEVRTQSKVVLELLVDKALWLQKVKKEFDDVTFTLYGSFGIKFNNKELFAKAKKHLESSLGK